MDPTTYLDVYDSVIAASLENKISEIPALQMLLQLKFLRFHHYSKQKGPVLVVMEGDSCSKGSEFESQHHIMDGHFFPYLFAVKIVTLFENDKNKRKSSRVGPFLKPSIAKDKTIFIHKLINTQWRLWL